MFARPHAHGQSWEEVSQAESISASNKGPGSVNGQTIHVNTAGMAII